MQSEKSSFAARITKKLWIIAPIFILTYALILFPLGMRSVHAQTGHSIKLTWNAPTTGGAPTSYNVKRGTSAGTETQLATVPVAQTNFTDSTGTGGTTYFYIITAVNSGGESAPSNEVSAIFLAAAPGSPSGLVAASN